MILVQETTRITCNAKGCDETLLIDSTNLSASRVAEIARTKYYWIIDRAGDETLCPEHKKERYG